MAKSSISMKTKKNLLIIIVFLAMIRFFVMPFTASQNDDVAELAMITSQLERAERLLSAPEDRQGQERLESMLQTRQKDFLAYSSSSNFRLAAQREIQSVVEGNNSQVNLFDWLTSEMLYENFIHRHQARVIIEGRLEDVFQSQIDMISANPGLIIREQVIQQQRVTGRRRAGDARVRANLLIEVSGVVYQN